MDHPFPLSLRAHVRAWRYLTMGLAVVLLPLTARVVADEPATQTPLVVTAPAEPVPPAPAVPLAADASARDVLRRVIEPFVDVFAEAPEARGKAFTLRMRLVTATNQPPELQGRTLTLYCQPPDKVCFQLFALGTVVTVSRQGQQVWASPASKLAPILQQVQTQKLSRADQQPLAALRLTVPRSLFWLLFRFAAKVRDGGGATLDKVSYRRLEMDAPEKEDKGKGIRVWVRQDNGRATRLDWHSSTDRATVLFDEPRFSPALPAEVFAPDAAAKADLLQIPIQYFRPFMKRLGEEEDKRQKAVRDAKVPAAAGTSNSTP